MGEEALVRPLGEPGVNHHVPPPTLCLEIRLEDPFSNIPGSLGRALRGFVNWFDE